MARIFRSAQLAGRATELSDISSLIDRARQGEGATVLVTGEGGVGKSRLLTEAAAVANRAGLPVLAGRAASGNGAYRPLSEALLGYLRGADLPETPELRPFRSAIGRLVPGWTGGAGEPDPGTDPAVVTGEGLLRLLRAIGAGDACVLILDDLHWADPDTVATLDYLAAAVGSSPVLLLLAARVEPPGAAVGPGGRAAVRMPLRRLDDDELLRMAGGCLGGSPIPDEVHRFLVDRSDGLPLLVEELLAGLVESGSLRESPAGWQLAAGPAAPVPRTLVTLVAGRLATLTPPQRKVVEAAAVLGPEASWRILPTVTGLSEDEVLDGLQAAADAQLLVSGAAGASLDRGAASGWLRWRHALTRDAVLDQIQQVQHAVLARRGAEAIAAIPEETRTADDDAVAAALYVRAGDPGLAARLWRRQARRALALGALRSAEDLLDAAARADPSAPGLAAERVALLTVSGRTADALAAGDADLITLTGDEHAVLCWALARACVAGGHWDEAARYLDRVGRDDDPRTLAVAADAAFGAGRPDRAAQLAARALAVAERDALPEQQCEALQVLGRCAQLTDPAAAAAAFLRSAQIAAEHGLGPARILALVSLGIIELLDGESSDTLGQARGLALDAGMLAKVSAIDLLLADCLTIVEGPAAGAALAESAAALAADLRLTGIQAMLETMTAAAQAVSGDLAGMRTTLDRAAARPQAPSEVTAMRPCIEALAPLMAHDLVRAGTLLDEGVRRLAGNQVTAPMAYWGLWVLVRTVLGDRDEHARNQLAASPAHLRSVNRAAALCAEAVALGRSGDRTGAALLFDEANALLPGPHWWGRLLRQLTASAQIADGWGDPVTVLRADLAIFEAAAVGSSAGVDGAVQLARTSRDLLRRAGVSVRRGRGNAAVPPALRAQGVTSREMDVLTLLGDRLTNAEIAARLYLSERTIETHVSNLLAKTGAANRTDLAATATTPGPSAAGPAR